MRPYAPSGRQVRMATRSLRLRRARDRHLAGVPQAARGRGRAGGRYRDHRWAAAMPARPARPSVRGLAAGRPAGRPLDEVRLIRDEFDKSIEAFLAELARSASARTTASRALRERAQSRWRLPLFVQGSSLGKPVETTASRESRSDGFALWPRGPSRLVPLLGVSVRPGKTWAPCERASWRVLSVSALAALGVCFGRRARWLVLRCKGAAPHHLPLAHPALVVAQAWLVVGEEHLSD
jgi:hypothetical protein